MAAPRAAQSRDHEVGIEHDSLQELHPITLHEAFQ